jgi:hypothetical protein
MSFEFTNWLSWSNPVSLWWVFLISVSLLNILFWIWTHKYLSYKNNSPADSQNYFLKSIIWLSLLYVLGCAFRSVLPRADVQRICLFDTWLSSVFIGRTIATIAELAFVAQWAIVLNQIAKLVNSKFVEQVSKFIFPLICMAECFSWYAVIRTHYLGNMIEESTWAFTYLLILLCLFNLFPKFKGAFRLMIALSIVCTALYVLFMIQVDVPMYYHRLMADTLSGKALLSFSEGIYDLQTRWIVSHEIEHWKDEIPWMSLYFSAAVWTSLALCYVPLNRNQIKKHLA